MKVMNEIKCIEINDEEIKGLTYPILKVRSHWNWTDRIVLQFEDGDEFTVLVKELNMAINNASNH